MFRRQRTSYYVLVKETVVHVYETENKLLCPRLGDSCPRLGDREQATMSSFRRQLSMFRRQRTSYYVLV